MTNSYDDMIHMPHHVSLAHPHMSIPDRAAQFSPFAALTGYEGAVKETARRTDDWKELDENAKEILDAKLQILQKQADAHPEITVTYFQPDNKKFGGAYLTIEGRIQKIDSYKHTIVMQSNIILPIDTIVNLTGTVFNAFEDF